MAMKACVVCPHQSDCLKVGSCLDDLNARYCAENPNQFPRLMTPAQAKSAMALLRAGKTLRRFTNGGKFGKAIVSRTKLRNHCAHYSEWGREVVRLAKANEKAADAMKSPKLYMRLCKYGHPLDCGRVYFRYGYECRRCRKCDKLRNARAGVLKPGDIEKVSIALRNGVTVSQIIHGIPMGGGPRNSSLILVNTVAFYRFRRDNPEFNGFVLASIDKRIGTSVNPVLAVPIGTFKYEWDPADHQLIQGMLPQYLPDRDVVIQDVIVCLLEGRLDRSQISAKIRYFIRAQNSMFPTKYAKFGNSPLVSLDEVLYDDGSAARGDNVSVGFWG